MSREALAFRAGLSTGSLQKIELSQSAPNWTNFCGIADGLGLSITLLAALIEGRDGTPDRGA
jgi:hypothetical protein